MDCDFPDPDEEFDLVHEDEYEVLRELEAAELQKTGTGKTVQQQEQQQQRQPPPQPEQQKTCQTQADNNEQTQSDCSAKSQNKESQAKDVSLVDEEIVVSQSHSKKNKRSIDDISQNIPSIPDIFDPMDLIDLDQFGSPKKKRPCWDQPEQVIKLIVERRKNGHNDNAQIGEDNALISVGNKSNGITRRVPGYNFIAVTRIDDGERFYIKVSDKNKQVSKKNHRPTSNFLIKSFDQLKNEAEQILKVKAEKANLPSSDIVEITGHTSSDLWVDKYRPQRYLDLMSDETINRSLLYWLKLWDKIVFDRDPTVRKRKPETHFKSKKFFKKEEDVPDYDSKGFPTQRIVLLSGPPGLGKTTLAHVAAKHAGYNVVELNASDDRGPEAFREALLASTQMRAVIDKDKRPNCLVLDEIDGAPAASIELLLKFIHGKLAPKGKTVKDKSKENDGCRRPIICICNDLYTPSLRPLRSMALVISVPEISPLALAERLAIIIRKEGLKVDMRILIQLAEKSACDVRACLGILQYTGGGSKIIQNLAFGLKDMRKGLFDSWKEMLQIPMSRLNFLSVPERVQKITKLAHQVETDRLVQGVFHNYPTVCKDQIVPVSKSLQWFEFYDEVNSMVMEHQTWTLMPYTNSAIVAWHLYLSNSQSPKITYPSVAFEVNQKLERNKAILMITKKTCKTDVQTLVSDVLPYLPDFLCPRLRPVNFQLYSSKEKQELEKLVNVMLDFGLTFTQVKKADGGYQYLLDPNLWELGTFPDCKVRKPMAYGVKQIVIQELETARIRRAAIMSGETTASGSDKASSSKASSRKNTVDLPANPPKSQENVPNHLRQLNPIELQPVAEKKNRNFFAAFQLAGQEKYKKKVEEDKAMGIVNTKEIEKKEKEEADKKKNKIFGNNIWYEYKEGYSNAVRRTVLMKDLL